ncbi:hypothetical protein O181_062717 [Austropuccinia psidii MF-1]|uniref:Uncharacterized protein n=1 Tax=Austropuccinia psidii MF-1 TaxID=1389203 RepID=A0A9Q3I0M4_9BASI|nr:hypothetical protein [Austropuccinia psidii MF-1]
MDLAIGEEGRKGELLHCGPVPTSEKRLMKGLAFQVVFSERTLALRKIWLTVAAACTKDLGSEVLAKEIHDLNVCLWRVEKKTSDGVGKFMENSQNLEAVASGEALLDGIEEGSSVSGQRIYTNCGKHIRVERCSKLASDSIILVAWTTCEKCRLFLDGSVRLKDIERVVFKASNQCR